MHTLQTRYHTLKRLPHHPELTLQHLATSRVSHDDLVELMKDHVLDVPSSRHRWLKIATDDVDRAGDVMEIAGCDYSRFLLNPQFLWQHGLTREPVHTIGRIVSLHRTEHALFALAEYAEHGAHPLADLVYRLDIDGFLPANSIGFRPIEWEELPTGGYRFTKWELVECSKVELPMNPYAIDDASLNASERSLASDVAIEDAAEWLLDIRNPSPSQA